MRLVRVLTDNGLVARRGLVGLGEAAHDCHAPTVAYAIRGMPLVGRDPLAIEAFWRDLHDGTFCRRHLLAGFRGAALSGERAKAPAP